MLRITILVFVFIAPQYESLGQDIQKAIGDVGTRLKRDPVKVYGAVDLLGQLYQSKNQTAYYPDLTYRAFAQLQFDIAGIQAPFSFLYSNGNSIYHLPAYTFAGISPTYKWGTVHLGDRSLELSPYTLSGHQFRGIGLELKPGRFRFTGMYGRLKRAVADDYLTLQGLDPAFKRMGWGIKSGYETEKAKIALTMFHAQDETSSIPFEAHTSILQPAENLALALQTYKRWGPWSAQLDYTYSLFSRDTRATTAEESNYAHHILGLFTPRFSSAYRHAWMTKVNYNAKKVLVGFQFDHVDPGFRSLGTLYFQDDFENYTIHARVNALKNKLTLAVRSGIQRNYLERNESNQILRGIGSAQINYSPLQNLQWQLQWSNISNTVRFRNNLNPTQPLDSLYLVSTQSQAGTTLMYNWGNGQESGLVATFQYQKGQTIVDDAIQLDLTRFLFAQAAYSYRAGKTWNMNISLQFTQNTLSALHQSTIGPSLQYQRSFLKNRLLSAWTLVDQEIYTEAVHSHRVINILWQNTYQLRKQHQLYLRLNRRSRYLLSDAAKSSSDLITELGYALKW
ncbi:MAG: hypothetical protein WBB93_00115 [Saprospiraceae bacterium]